MAADPVTPIPGLASTVVVGGTPVTVAAGGNNGGYIVNPASAADQGIAPANPESLFVDPTGADPSIGAFGTTFEIQPGGSWQFVPGQTTPTKVNANTGGHRFSVVLY